MAILHFISVLFLHLFWKRLFRVKWHGFLQAGHLFYQPTDMSR